MELDQRVSFLEKTVSRLEKLVDGNGDSLVTKFERALNSHTEQANMKFSIIDSKLENLSVAQTAMKTQLENDCRRIKELEDELDKADQSKDSLNTQLIILLAVTLLNLILGGIKVFGG